MDTNAVEPVERSSRLLGCVFESHTKNVNNDICGSLLGTRQRRGIPRSNNTCSLK